MLIVGSCNMQNKFFMPQYNGIVKRKDNALLLKHFLYKYHVDILGTQELVAWYLKRCQELLESTYQVTGSFRYPRLFLKKYNETNSIVTKNEILKSYTFHLPTFPTITPRILTCAIITTKELGTILFLNTHLTLHQNKVQTKQLNRILEEIKKSPYPVILTGDFNMTIDNPCMKKFIQSLKTLQINRVPVFEKTYKNHTKERAIDHIFYSTKLKLIKFAVIKDEEFASFSDHYPILAWFQKS